MQQHTASPALILCAVAAALVAVAAGWWIAQPPADLTPHDRIAAEIGCVCGTCPNRPIATCGCGFADGMLAELQTLLDEGSDEPTIRAAFVERYGNQVKIVPSARGFELTAWAAPLVLLLVGAVIVGGLLTGWTRAATVTTDDQPGSPQPAAKPSATAVDAGESELRERVERELDDYQEH